MALTVPAFMSISLINVSASTAVPMVAVPDQSQDWDTWYPDTPVAARGDATRMRIHTTHSNCDIERGGYRFFDNDSEATYRLPLAKLADVPAGDNAWLILTLSGRFALQISDTDSFSSQNPVPKYTEASGSKYESRYDMMPYIREGKEFVYFRISNPLGGGNGPQIHRIALVYFDYKVPDVKLKEVPAQSFSFAPCTPSEFNYIISGNGEEQPNHNMRFVDGTRSMVYRIPYDGKQSGKIVMALGGNFVVSISEGSWDPATQSYGAPTRNADYREIYKNDDPQYWDPNHDSWPGNKDEKSEHDLVDPKPTGPTVPNHIYYDTRAHENRNIDYLYLRFTDRTTWDGNGAWIYRVGYIMEKDYSRLLYQPYTTARNPAVKPYGVYTVPSRPPTPKKSQTRSRTTSTVIPPSVIDDTPWVWDDTYDVWDIEEIEDPINYGTIQGRLTDEHGQPLSNVTLVLRDTEPDPEPEPLVEEGGLTEGENGEEVAPENGTEQEGTSEEETPGETAPGEGDELMAITPDVVNRVDMPNEEDGEENGEEDGEESDTFERITETNDNGEYTFDELEAGTYELFIRTEDGEDIPSGTKLTLEESGFLKLESTFDGTTFKVTVIDPDAPQPEPARVTVSYARPTIDIPDQQSPIGWIIAFVIIGVVILGGGATAFIILQKNKAAVADGGDGSEEVRNISEGE